MLVQTACPRCHHPYPCQDAHEGKRIYCGFCQEFFDIDDPDARPTRHSRVIALGRTPRPRRRKRGLLYWRCGVVLVSVFLLVVMFLLIPLKLDAFKRKVSQENFARLAVGMAEREVKKMLGEPAWIDASDVPSLHGPVSRQIEMDLRKYPRRFYWTDGDDEIWVDLHHGRVTKFGALLDGERIGEVPGPIKDDEQYHPLDEIGD